MIEMIADTNLVAQNEMSESVNPKRVPLWHKTLLTVEEAAKYTGIGIQKLREISAGDDCRFVVWNGNRRLFKRRLLDEFLEESYSI